MSYFSTSVAAPVPVLRLQNGTSPNYLFGSFDNHTQPFSFLIGNVAVASNVVTANVTIIGGGGGSSPITGVAPLPVAGATMGVRGTTTSNGNLNVDPTVVLSSTINAISGIGNITYSATTANASSQVDTGLLVVQPYEYPDQMKVGASQAAAQIWTPDESSNDRCLFVDCKFPSSPVNCNVVLQVSNFNTDASFITVLNSAGSNIAAQVVGNVVTQQGAEYQFISSKFLRLAIVDVTSNANISSSIVGTIWI